VSIDIKKIKLEQDLINSKLDRIISILQQLPMTHNTDLGDWLTEAQARELLHYGATKLWELRKQRKVKFSKIGNRNMYSRESIIKLIEKNKCA
jgi:hypothetical protein